MADMPFDVEDEAPRVSPRPMPKLRGTVPKVGKVGNETLASQATEVLLQVNGFAALGAISFGYGMTASAIAEREQTFKDQIYQALLPDPRLCASILRAQGAGGIMSLIIAYVMLGVSIAPVAMMEYKAKKAAGEPAFRLAFLAPPATEDAA